MACGSSSPWPDLVYKSASKYGSVDGTYNSPIRTAEGIGSSSVSLSAALSFKGKEDSVAKGDPVDGVGDGDGRKRGTETRRAGAEDAASITPRGGPTDDALAGAASPWDVPAVGKSGATTGCTGAASITPRGGPTDDALAGAASPWNVPAIEKRGAAMGRTGAASITPRGGSNDDAVATVASRADALALRLPGEGHSDDSENGVSKLQGLPESRLLGRTGERLGSITISPSG